MVIRMEHISRLLGALSLAMSFSNLYPKITLFSSFDPLLFSPFCCVSHPLTYMTFVCFHSHRSKVRVDFAAYSFSQDKDREVVPTTPACEYFVAFLLIWREVDRFWMKCDKSYGHPPKLSPVCMLLTLFSFFCSPPSLSLLLVYFTTCVVQLQPQGFPSLFPSAC